MARPRPPAGAVPDRRDAQRDPMVLEQGLPIGPGGERGAVRRTSITSWRTCSVGPTTRRSTRRSTCSSHSADRSTRSTACRCPCRRVEVGGWALVSKVAAPRVMAGADVMPWRAQRGIYVVIENIAGRWRARSQLDELDDLVGVDGGGGGVAVRLRTRPE